MESNKRISELLVETGAYTDLDKPVILTSGELGIYYVNTEKLCQDSGKFKEHGDNSQAMIQHALEMIEEGPLGNPCAVNHLVDRGRREAVLVHQRLGRIDDFSASFGTRFRHGFF